MPWKITGTIIDPDGSPSNGAIVAIVSPTPARSTSGKLIDNDRVAIPVSGGRVADMELESVPGASWTFLLPRGRRVEIADPGDGAVVNLAADLPVGRPLTLDEAQLLRAEITRIQAEGLKGDAGPANTLSIGSVTSGSAAAAAIRGSAPNQILDLVLPKGDGGGGGTSSPGPANVLSIGSVTSGAQAAATITGTSPNQTLNLTLPKGDSGAPGKDGAQGAPGSPGKDGTSPPAPVFTASASTLAAGSAATAAVSGTYPNLALTFGIPRGADGAAGSGSGSSAYEMRGTGSPYGVVTPPAAGTYYTDTAGTMGAWRWIATGTSPTSWVVQHGDTGWWPIWRGATTDSSWGGTGSYGAVHIRRIGPAVHLAFAGNSAGMARMSNANFNDAGRVLTGALPSGWRPAAKTTTAIHKDGGAYGSGGWITSYVATDGGGPVAIYLSPAPSTWTWFAAYGSYPTAEPWPTAYPTAMTATQ